MNTTTRLLPARTWRIELIGAMVMTLLTGCASSPPVRYYQLQVTETVAADATAQPVILGLGPLNIPGYLDRPQIVTRGTGARLRVNDYERWAEPLQAGIERVVAVNIDNQLAGVAVAVFPYGSLIKPDLRLVGRLIQFDANAAGDAILDVQWALTTVGKTSATRPRRTRYTATAASSSDADAVAAALANTLGQFSRDVANELEQMLLTTPAAPDAP